MDIAYNTNIVRSGLVLQLDAANRKSYPGSGTTWADLSGLGNNGTLVNAVGYSTNDNGTMVFDGSNDYGYVNESPSIKPVNSLTVSTFIYPTLSTYTNCRLLGDWHQNANFDRWIFFAHGTGINWYMRTITTGEGGTAFWTIVPNKWVNLTGVYTGSSQDFYVDGVLFAQRPCSGIMNSGDGFRPIRFGQQGPYSGTGSIGTAFNGNIASIMLYDRALSAEEIQSNFNAMRGRYGI